VIFAMRGIASSFLANLAVVFVLTHGDAWPRQNAADPHFHRPFT